MDIASVVVGFLFGSVLTGIFSDAIAGWLLRAAPLRYKRQLGAVAGNPRLYFRLLRETEERKIFTLLTTLFKAWESKDLAGYSSCWAENAVRIVGVQSQEEENKQQITHKFEASCAKYAEIRVESLTLESITLGPTSDTAVAMVRYRFHLVRSRDQLPIVEDTREVYSLRLLDGAWVVASNIDHFYEIGEGVAS